jgi:hypothetical protein
MILQDRKRLALADHLSNLIADADSQNHLHPRDGDGGGAKILRLI